MPPGAPAITQYTIKIIELNDRYANYRDMLRNSSYPAFFETTVRSVPTYLYTPANPAFKEGKTYAWVVEPSETTSTRRQRSSRVLHSRTTATVNRLCSPSRKAKR